MSTNGTLSPKVSLSRQHDTGKCLPGSFFSYQSVGSCCVWTLYWCICMYIYVVYVCGESWSPWTIFGSCLVRCFSNADIPSGVERARSAGGQLLFVNFLTPIDLLNHSSKSLFFWVCSYCDWHMEKSRASKEF